MSEDDFVALVTEGQPSAPDYFVYDAVLNRRRTRCSTPRPRPSADARRGPRPAGGGRRRGRRARAAGVRRRAPARLAQRARRRPVRRDRRARSCAPDAGDRAWSPRRTARRRSSSGWPASASTASPATCASPRRRSSPRPSEIARASRRHRAPAGRRAGTGPVPPVVLDVRNAGELAAGAISRRPPHPARRSCPGALEEIPPHRPVVVLLRGRLPLQRRRQPAAPRRPGSDVSDLLGGYAAWPAAQAGEPTISRSPTTSTPPPAERTAVRGWRRSRRRRTTRPR